jgi:hypothetical protein
VTPDTVEHRGDSILRDTKERKAVVETDTLDVRRADPPEWAAGRQRWRRYLPVLGVLNPVRWPGLVSVLVSDATHQLLSDSRDQYAYSGRLHHYDSDAYADALVAWLCRCQDASEDGGFAAYYGILDGFGPSYPETTGYIMPTLLQYAETRGRSDLEGRVERAANWLLGLQFASGAFPARFGRSGDGPAVFNTGQIIFGLLAWYRRSRVDRYLDAAVRAGRWLTEVQGAEGRWDRFTFLSRPHCYYSMVSWALCELWRLTEEEAFIEAARRNLNWVLSVQEPNGWFRELNLTGYHNFLHFIAYTMQGLLESGVILEQAPYVDAARLPAWRLARRFELTKALPGAFDTDWRPTTQSLCLTGIAQVSLVLERLYEVSGDLRYLNTALKLNEVLKRPIRLRARPSVRGAVAGSLPCWGPYMTLRFPNWAAKFTLDALMHERRLLKSLWEQARGSQSP